MKMTPEFLEWFATNYPCTAKAVEHGDLDARGSQNIAWSGWQASREALVIELPSPDAYEGLTSELGSTIELTYEVPAYDPVGLVRLPGVRAAIEAAGVKVKS